jgi:Uma2 family endonuclease
MAVVIEGKTLLTYSDYVHFPEDGKRHEIIGGVHYVTPSPATKHQRVSRWAQFQLFEQIEVPGLGEVINAPMDLVLSDTDVVQPDLLVVLKKNRLIITPKHVRGVPDLVVEITSPSTEKRDLELKKNLYQGFGVPEYWVVLTEEDTVEKYVLDGRAYVLAGRFRDSIEFGGISGVKVDLTKVW